ncbi:MAG: MBL fold metallo-hydrolase [Christensenella sp.]|uniref:MBL fold metallo-hydrolase n=1 Tax=Christensenella sp. TaxID=1935934 RepID=UPI002B21B901|nr:MBL fold metallo-hydrolase [Christensenella sp.]MEA5003286.1 MBL fold metallo-hydrolase [Christensenella sp.]
MNQFKFFGFSTFLITTDDGTTILIDPYIDDNPTAPMKTKDLPKIDLILASHGAFDHMQDTAKIAARDKSKIICGGETMNLLIDQGVDPALIKNSVWGLTVEQCGIKVRPVVSMHRSSVRLSDGTAMDGFALGFIIYLPDGTKVYNASDTALFSDLKLIGELHQPHVGLINVTIENCFDFLPEFLTGEMTPYEAALACQWLGLEYAVACHYTNKDNKDVKEFEELLNLMKDKNGHGAPIPVIMDPGETFEYSAKQ